MSSENEIPSSPTNDQCGPPGRGIDRLQKSLKNRSFIKRTATTSDTPSATAIMLSTIVEKLDRKCRYAKRSERRAFIAPRQPPLRLAPSEAYGRRG
jgi:hypothetical protein